MTKLSTRDYRDKNLDTTKKHLVVNNDNVEKQQMSTIEQHVELIKSIELKEKKQALFNQQIKTVSVFLSILFQLIQITSVAVSNVDYYEKVETPVIELCNDHIKKQ